MIVGLTSLHKRERCEIFRRSRTALSPAAIRGRGAVTVSAVGTGDPLTQMLSEVVTQILSEVDPTQILSEVDPTQILSEVDLPLGEGGWGVRPDGQCSYVGQAFGGKS